MKVAKSAVKHAGREGYDVVIVDTAGRLHVDEDMMREARRVKDAIDPHHVLMACDAMTGQDAVIQARAFMKEVDMTGFVLTKLDGDARGGAALSITAVTGRPVFFAGTGERPEDLEPFYPDRMASRILGMGDVLSLIDKAQENLDQEQAAETAEKMLSARFTLEDFLVQMQELRKLGPLQDLLAMLPSVPGGKNALKDLEVDDGQLGRARGHHPVHDQGGAAESRYHRRVPALADRARFGRDHRGRQRAAQAVRAGEEDDEEHDGRQAHAPGPGDAEASRVAVRSPRDMSVRIRLKRLGAKKRPSTASSWPTSAARATAGSSRTSASTSPSTTLADRDRRGARAATGSASARSPPTPSGC